MLQKCPLGCPHGRQNTIKCPLGCPVSALCTSWCPTANSWCPFNLFSPLHLQHPESATGVNPMYRGRVLAAVTQGLNPTCGPFAACHPLFLSHPFSFPTPLAILTIKPIIIIIIIITIIKTDMMTHSTLMMLKCVICPRCYFQPSTTLHVSVNPSYYCKNMFIF